MRLAPIPIVVILSLGVPPPSAACEYDDCHATGAVPKPGGWNIRLPFENGERVEVLSGYGPSAGSGLHCRAQDSYCANDYHALDFVLPDHPDYGKGQPVLAIADGVVWHAGWSSGDWANYGLRAYILHGSVGDGHQYASLYAHLNDLFVSDGQTVTQGDIIGELGQSCQGDYECGSFSTPHVHFALHRDSNYGGSGTGGSYGGRATVPEPFDGYSGIQQWDELFSTNGGGGDDDDDDDDDDTSGECAVDPTVPTVLEEDGPCAARTGDAGGYHDFDGNAGHSWWTAQDELDPDYAHGVVWSFEFAAGGDFELSAHVPAGLDELTDDADYKVQHGGGSEHVHVPQAAGAGGWIPLGTFEFAAGGDQWVRLGDNHVDPDGAQRRVLFDALKLVPFQPCDCDVTDDIEARPCDNGGVQVRTCDGCHWSQWSECEEPPDDDDLGDDDTAGQQAGPGDGTGDCSCGHQGARGNAWFPMMLAAALVLRRRGRRRHRSRVRGILPATGGKEST